MQDNKKNDMKTGEHSGRVKTESETRENHQNQNKEATASTRKSSKKNKSKSPSRLRKLQEELEQTRKERDELKDLLLRKAAEFDNFKRRTENEYVQLIANANADLIKDLLPVVDDLERSLAAAREKEDFAGLLSGVELIYKSFSKVLEERGVKPIPAVGEEFDPEKHDALMQLESKEHAPGIVVDEHRKGYELNGRVLRHSQVLVSK